MSEHHRYHGILTGTALGDSIGLPAEGLSPTQIQKLGWHKNWKQRFIFGRGMWSDDTEHTVILSQALLESGGDLKVFQKKLAWGMKLWLLGLPAGIGMATTKGILRLWFGMPAHRSGVFSGGNGPAMRAAMLGAYFANNAEKRRAFNQAQTRITHTDPKAEYAALAVVELAAFFSRETRAPNHQEFIELLNSITADQEWKEVASTLDHHLKTAATLKALLNSFGCRLEKGISGYCYHTVPAVLFIGSQENWNTEKVLARVWSAGGDADTTGAIAGALCGCLNGSDSFPSLWSNQLFEWPTSYSSLNRLATGLETNNPIKIRSAFHPLLFLRNALFFITVLVHGLARIRLLFLREKPVG